VLETALTILYQTTGLGARVLPETDDEMAPACSSVLVQADLLANQRWVV
jgi:hypothetical protein